MTESNDGLPRFARIRVEQAIPRGHVEIIQVRPQRLAPTVVVEAWDLRSDADHGRSSERGEAWGAVCPPLAGLLRIASEEAAPVVTG